MNYYFLRLGQGNNEAEHWLGMSPPKAAMYLDAKNERAYEGGAGNPQVKLFWNAGKVGNRDRTVMVVIH